jgi:hypothetical protein
MYAMGIPLGILVDRKGPRPAAFLGALCLGGGYFPIKGGKFQGQRALNKDLRRHSI